MSFVSGYASIKRNYDSAKKEFELSVIKAFEEYKRQKHKVSTRTLKPWTKWYVYTKSCKVKGSRVSFERLYNGVYGYQEFQHMSLPVKVIDIAHSGSKEELSAAIAEIILEEGEKILRNEARRNKLKEEHIRKKEISEYERLKEIYGN